jgi:hypothetical protein
MAAPAPMRTTFGALFGAGLLAGAFDAVLILLERPIHRTGTRFFVALATLLAVAAAWTLLAHLVLRLGWRLGGVHVAPATAGLVALGTAFLLVPLAEGPGARTLPLAGVWPAVAGLLLAGLGLLAHGLARRASWRRPLAASAVCAAVLAMAADQRVLPGLYPHGHSLLVLVALAALSFGIRWLKPPAPEPPLRWGRLAALAILLLPFGLRVLPQPDSAHAVLTTSSSGARLVGHFLEAGIHPGWRQRLDGQRFAEIAGASVRGIGAGLRARPLVERVPLLLLITLEALRSDRIGAIREGGSLTPNLDAQMRRGIATLDGVAAANASHDALLAILSARYPPDASGAAAEVLGRFEEEVGARLVCFFPDGNLLAHDDLFSEFEVHRVGQYGEDFTDEVEEVLRTHAPRPLLLWVHIPDPHAPYEPRPEDHRFGDDAIGRYEGEVWALDQALEELLAAARRTYGRDRMAAAITADHGEAFGEHGVYVHKSGLHEEQIRVPWVVKGPGMEVRRLQHPAGHVDLLPTLCAVAGWPLAPGHDGRDLSRAEEDRPQPLFAIHEKRGVAVREGRWKLIFDRVSLRRALHDLEVDPLEQKPLGLDARGPGRHLETRVLAFDLGPDGALSRVFGRTAVLAAAEEAAQGADVSLRSFGRRVLSEVQR